MPQVQKSIMERQAIASGTPLPGGVPRCPSSLGEGHVSRAGGLGMAGQASVKHRTSFYTVHADSDSAPSDDGSDADFPSDTLRGKSAPELNLQASLGGPTESAEEEGAEADDVDLAMLPRRHGRMLQAQMTGAPRRPRER